MGKLEKWYGRIESLCTYYNRAAYYTEQLLHRAASCKILELLEHLSMAVSIAIFSSDAKKIRSSWRAIPKYYFFRRTTRGVGGRPPLSFFENWEKCPDFGKKTLIVSIFWVKYSIQIKVLRVSRKKNFLSAELFPVFPMKCLPKCPSFMKLPLLLNISGWALVWQRQFVKLVCE